LKDEKCCELFLANLEFYRKKFELKVYGYCLMPDHVHLLSYFDNEKFPDLTISKVMHGIKGYSSKVIYEYLRSQAGRQGSYALPRLGQGAGLH
jgi:REP element-mobilizing transposase RayT